MKKILVPVDFTSYSDNAIRFAGYFAGVKGMDIRFVHFFEKKSTFPLIQEKENQEDYLPQLTETAKEYIEKEVTDSLPENVNYEIDIREVDSIAEAILQQEDDIDVVVIGQVRPEKRENPLKDTITERIVRDSAIPVISVGSLPQEYAIRNIAFASDFQEEKLKRVLQRVFDLAELFEADLHLIYVHLNREFTTAEKTAEKVQELLKKYDLQDYDLNIFVAGTEEEGIAHYVDENATDLLIMATHGRRGLAHFLKPSIAENISSYGEVPVLTYNISDTKIDRSTKPIAREMIRKRVEERNDYEDEDQDL